MSFDHSSSRNSKTRSERGSVMVREDRSRAAGTERAPRRPIDGVLLLDKPVGLTSAQAIARVKWLIGCEKIGHAGTLDPDASGLLVCLLGRATRLASFAEAGSKDYSGSIELGVTTSTDDLAGTVFERRAVTSTEAEVRAVVNRFVGPILQVPPQVSALKVAGERAYARARAGLTSELAPRPVTVERFTVRRYDRGTIEFDCTVSKGTYIRSLARDIGAALGCGGALGSLRREASQPFFVSRAVGLDGNLQAAILPWAELFPAMPRFTVTPLEGRALLQGDRGVLARLPAPGGSETRALYATLADGPLGLVEWTAAGWRIGVNVPPPVDRVAGVG